MQLNTVAFLTVLEVADRLRVHPETVREWVRQGKLEAVYAGRRIRVSEDQLQRFLQPTGRGR